MKTIKTTIVQPRLHNISTEELDASELVKWGLETVRPQAMLAYDGKGEFHAGSHCRFCKIRHTCRERAEQMQDVPVNKDKHLLSDDEIAELLHKAPQIKRWADELEKYALEQAIENGKELKGWKVVEGRANRKYVDNEQVFEKLTAEYDPAEVSETKVLSISKLEKKLGKKKVQELLSDLITKPQGKATLVTDNDKRDSIISNATEDFKDLI